MPSYSLAWREHLKTFSSGISSLQQNEEFVDMTLAADGHFVKVHKVILALASPYLKDVISSMECQKPVIFLHGVSYSILCLILEYIYTGEVLVTTNNINDFLDVARNLKIRGLSELQLDHTLNVRSNHNQSNQSINRLANDTSMDVMGEDCEFIEDSILDNDSFKDTVHTQSSEDQMDIIVKMNSFNNIMDQQHQGDRDEKRDIHSFLQYTMSNQGSLQMILNNYIYYLKHTNKDNTRQWRCVDYLNKWKCPAALFTKNDVVIQRLSSHCHANHARKIFKKINSGVVYTKIQEAESKCIKDEKNIDTD